MVAPVNSASPNAANPSPVSPISTGNPDPVGMGSIAGSYNPKETGFAEADPNKPVAVTPAKGQTGLRSGTIADGVKVILDRCIKDFSFIGGGCQLYRTGTPAVAAKPAETKNDDAKASNTNSNSSNPRDDLRRELESRLGGSDSLKGLILSSLSPEEAKIRLKQLKDGRDPKEVLKELQNLTGWKDKSVEEKKPEAPKTEDAPAPKAAEAAPPLEVQAMQEVK